MTSLRCSKLTVGDYPETISHPSRRASHSRRERNPMPRNLLTISIILMAFLLAGCGSAQASLEEVQVAATTPTVVITEFPVIQAPAETQATEEPQVETAEADQVDYCEQCHTSEQMLIDTANPDLYTQPESLWGSGIPMQPWEKVLVDGEKFLPSIHGLNGCIDCHDGQNDPDKEVAHQGVVHNPSRDAQAVCGQCHPNIVSTFPNSLHNNLAGFQGALDERAAPKTHPALEEAFADQCQDCHTTCGECHVSQPNSVGGGFVNGHLFMESPSMIQNCTACHESRVGSEYLGRNEGLEADVHLSQGSMKCTDCHDGTRMHGEGDACNTCHNGPTGSETPPPDHRYAGAQSPRCESCHEVVATGQDEILMHQMHGNKLSCQVCHAISYKTCDGCHIQDAQDGSGTEIELDKVDFTFLIGRNTQQTYDRPYEYVPVRHAPVDQETFSYYGIDLMPNFDQRATWQYTTPHNIQRKTSQASSCNNCHGNPDLFLTADKLSPEELEANRDVIVEDIPPKITSAEQLP
jgi:hypothetical protein